MVMATLSVGSFGNASNAVQSVRTLDGKCMQADQCPRGQGFYFRAILAEDLGGTASAPQRGILRLSVIPREDGGNGTDFSVVTVVSEV